MLTLLPRRCFSAAASPSSRVFKKNPFDFTDKVVLVTGAASGIGKAAALAFAECGAKVAIGDWSAKGADVAAQIKASGGDAIFVKTDVSKEADVKQLVSKTVSTYGRLNVAFNNAGVIHDTVPFADITPAMWERTIGVNLNGVYYCMRAEIAEMKKAGGGSIINTASIGGMSSVYNLSAYVAAKHGVIGLTRAAAHDHAGDKIRVNALAPGGVSTGIMEGVNFNPANYPEMTQCAQKRQADPAELASTILLLASDSTSFTSGAVMVVDGMQVHKF